MRTLFIKVSRLNEGIYFATVCSIFDEPRLLYEQHPKVRALKKRQLAKLLNIPTDDPNGWERQKIYADAKVLECVEPFYRDIMMATSIYNTLCTQENTEFAKTLCQNTIQNIQEQAVYTREGVVCELLSKLDNDDNSKFESDFIELRKTLIKDYEDREKRSTLSSLRSALIRVRDHTCEGAYNSKGEYNTDVKQALLPS